MTQTSSITFVGDILPLWVPYVPPKRELIGNFDGSLLNRDKFFHKAYNTSVHLKNVDMVFLTKFLAFNLANNHSFDAGFGNFKGTVELIRSIGAVPYGFNENPVAELKVGKLSIGVIGCLEKSYSRPAHLFKEEEVLDLIRSLKGRYDYLYVTPHWGGKSEFTPFAEPRKIRLGEKWIEAGAAAVFGTRPRAVQGLYGSPEHPIYASLGNFSYSHPQCDLYPISRMGLAVEVSFKSPSVKYTRRYYYNRRPLKNTLPAERYFEEISRLNYSNFNWVRLAGLTYVTKSFGSWKYRLWSGKNIMEPIKFLVWLFLPATLFLMLFSLFSIRPVIHAMER
ncbi:MAG TPA: CapA family protein, partial [bacterium]|nr:CapA family protein [bacterium]